MGGRDLVGRFVQQGRGIKYPGAIVGWMFGLEKLELKGIPEERETVVCAGGCDLYLQDKVALDSRCLFVEKSTLDAVVKGLYAFKSLSASA